MVNEDKLIVGSHVHFVNTHGIGDVVMMIPLIIKVLRDKPKKISFTLKSQVEKSVIQLFIKDENFDYFFFENTKLFSFKIFSLFKTLRKQKIDQLIFANGMEYKKSILLSIFLNVFQTIPSRKNLFYKLLKANHNIHTHKVIGNYKLVSNKFDLNDIDLEARFNEVISKKEIISDFEAYGDALKENCLAIAPGSGEIESYKRWPSHKFKNLISKINNSYPEVKIFILGNELENIIGEELVKDNVNVVNLCGNLSIKETANLLSRCSIAITNCNGISHLAGALGCSVIGIYGPTDYKKTGPFIENFYPVTTKNYSPWYSRKTVKGKKNFSDLEEISENKVFDVFKTVFQKDKKDLFKYAYRHVELKQFL